jgi:hypothetical protein
MCEYMDGNLYNCSESKVQYNEIHSVNVFMLFLPNCRV